MASEVVKFIRLLEARESWTVDQDRELLKQCWKIADSILKSPERTPQVPFHLWLVFLAALPFGDSIIALGRLQSAIGNALTLMVTPRPEKDYVNEARTIMIHRCNVLVRNDMQKLMYSGKEELIARIASELQE